MDPSTKEDFEYPPIDEVEKLGRLTPFKNMLAGNHEARLNAYRQEIENEMGRQR
jgi:hypothetical protein